MKKKRKGFWAGKKLSEEHKRKISKSMKGTRSKETREKISRASKKRWRNPEYRKKMSEALKGKSFWMKGKTPWMKGKHHTEKTRRRMSESQKGMKKPWLSRPLSRKHRKKIGEAQMGKKNHNWRGGISFEPYTTDWTETLKRSIRERDNYICQLCNQYGKAVHHIDYNKANCNPKNLITLCRRCHSKTHTNREHWTEYFNQKMKQQERLTTPAE